MILQNQDYMKSILHKAIKRGKTDYGWLKANYYFSFAQYYNPENLHFGLLRVLNDDFIAPGMGFDTHPHENMEIITIPLSGSLAHKDSTGGTGIITPGEVQVMSAGSGVEHSEYNNSTTDPLTLFQIWIFPKLRNIQPRYDQKRFEPASRAEQFQLIVSPLKSKESLWINQETYLSLGNFSKGKKIDYSLYINQNGVYLVLIKGKIKVGDEELNTRDAIGICITDKFTIEILENSELLLIEVPMH